VSKCKVCHIKISKYSILGYCKSCSNKFAHRRGITKHFCSICKTNEISITNFLYGKQHCIYCNAQLRSKDGDSMYGKKRPDLVLLNKQRRKYHKKYCPICHKEINYYNFYCKKHIYDTFKGKKRPEHSKRMMGNNNPAFIDGNGKFPYPLGFNKKLKLLIRKRDNYTCQRCGKEGTHVHHIDYTPSNIEKSNLIAVCDKCNKQVNFDRDYWYAYFTYIMGDKWIKTINNV